MDKRPVVGIKFTQAAPTSYMDFVLSLVDFNITAFESTAATDITGLRSLLVGYPFVIFKL